MKKEKSMSKIWTKLLSYVPLSNRKGLNIDPIKDRVHSEMKTCERLNYCLNNQAIRLIFPKVLLLNPRCFRLLNLNMRGPASHHLGICITPSENLHHIFEGPASQHLWTCLEHPNMHQAIHGPASHHPRTCITPSVDLLGTS